VEGILHEIEESVRVGGNIYLVWCQEHGLTVDEASYNPNPNPSPIALALTL